MGQLLLDGVPIGVPDRSVTAAGVSYDDTATGLGDDLQEAVDNSYIKYVDVPFSTSVPANNGAYAVVNPTMPSGFTNILSASVIFSTVNHFIWHDLCYSSSEWRVYLHNTYSGAQTISGSVRFLIGKHN